MKPSLMPFVARFVIPLCAVAAAGSPVLAVTSPQGCVTSYTSSSTSICNSTNTSWTCVDTKTCTTVCTASASGLKGGVEYGPIGVGPPTVTITDTVGNPIMIGSVMLQMIPSASGTSEAEALYGTISQQHVWSCFESNVLLPSIPVGTTGSAIFVITYTWPVPVLSEGAVWFSDNGDDLYGTSWHVIDAIEGLQVPAASHTSYGAGCYAGFNPLTLSASPTPVGGSVVTYETSNLPEFVPSSGVYIGLNILSFGQAPAPGIDLTFLGAPGCFLQVTTLDLTQAMVGLTPTQDVTIAIPIGLPIGTQLFSQSAALFQPNSLPNGENAFGATTSNGIASSTSFF